MPTGTTSLLRDLIDLEDESTNYDLASSDLIKRFILDTMPGSDVTPLIKVHKVDGRVILSIAMYQASTERLYFANYSFDKLDEIYGKRNDPDYQRYLRALAQRFVIPEGKSHTYYEKNGFQKFELVED